MGVGKIEDGKIFPRLFFQDDRILKTECVRGTPAVIGRRAFIFHFKDGRLVLQGVDRLRKTGLFLVIPAARQPEKL